MTGIFGHCFRPATAALALAAVVSIAGCGSGHPPQATTRQIDQRQIIRVVLGAVSLTRAACDRNFTDAGLEDWTLTFDSVDAARQKCYRDSVLPQPPWLRSARVRVISDDGVSAAALLTFPSGPQQSITRKVQLAYQGGWKIDRVRRVQS